MAKRVTIMVNDDNNKSLKKLQSKLIPIRDGSVSYSQVINEVIEVGLAHYKVK